MNHITATSTRYNYNFEKLEMNLHLTINQLKYFVCVPTWDIYKNYIYRRGHRVRDGGEKCNNLSCHPVPCSTFTCITVQCNVY